MTAAHQDFSGICEAPSLREAVRELEAVRLARLITWLRLQGVGTIRSLVLGIAELEAADRFTLAHTKP
jgi:hypothetical protein